jgi:hypothetical protein
VRVLLAALLAACLSAQACTASGGCTDVGGIEGIVILVPKLMFVSTGAVEVEVCDADGCASATQRLGRVPEGPVGRETIVGFDALGRSFDPGDVDVTARLTGPDGALAALTEAPVELVASYPNGEACDGDGYVSGTLRMAVSDWVRPAR